DLMKSNRELAAILFTDVSNFTSTMDTDENLAMDQVLRHKEIVSRSIQNYNGHLIKDMGDGLFVKFASAVESVQCAINIQQLINVENFSIRIGIHLGEIIIKNNDVFGSGVNIASRIHTASQPGSICISKEIWRQVKNQDDIHSKSLGKKAFKGVEEKIEVFELLNDKSSNINSMKYNKSFSYMKNKLFLATGFILTAIGGIFWVSYTFFDIGFTKSTYSASIAILEFKNISSEDNSIFAEGLTEELISQLTKIKNLKVTPRRDIDRYKNNDKIDINKIAEELKVEYIVDGSVRISRGKLRVNATLINPLESNVIWSDVYKDNLLDILKVQDKIAQQIISELNQKISNNPLLNDNFSGIHKGGGRNLAIS
ncbi:MAG: adenylate/guanylate cyclase domain-containing protein, partial [SAR202 cluster bacterium]|nr:adenylate/guanylate cyclase domain-containing protein [SAR202 cluster bacterium]